MKKQRCWKQVQTVEDISIGVVARVRRHDKSRVMVMALFESVWNNTGHGVDGRVA
jgi:hypothetical protein